MEQRPLPVDRSTRRYHRVDRFVSPTGRQVALLRRAGGIIGLVGGIFGVLAASATLVVGEAGAALKADHAGEVAALGWAGLLLSFLCIVLGALAMTAPGACRACC